MKVGGIVAEYNPFHHGHAYLIEQMRNVGVTHTVAVMSGNFVQRGDAAVCDKWSRCEMALENGVDLVLELPLPYAVATAQRFAAGAVGTLAALGSVDELFFGSECADTQALEEVALLLDDGAVISRMRELLDSGETFAAARQAAVTAVGARGEILRNPNDTLAVEYIRAISQWGAHMKPQAIGRIGAAHDAQAVDGIASASAIRRAIGEGDLSSVKAWMPQRAFEILQSQLQQGRCPAELSRLDAALLVELRKASVKALAALPDISEGLENRLYRAVREFGSVEQILSAVKSKRYTHARLRRILLYALLGLSCEMYDSPPVYIRVLGMNSRGRELLSSSKPTLPILTRTKDREQLDGRGTAMFELECTADDLYGLTLPSPQPCGATLTHGVIIK